MLEYSASDPGFWRYNSHPDELGILNLATSIMDGAPGRSDYSENDLGRRNVDSNFLWSDGHVETLRNRSEADQPRTEKVPSLSHLTHTTQYWIWLPPDD